MEECPEALVHPSMDEIETIVVKVNIQWLKLGLPAIKKKEKKRVLPEKTIDKMSDDKLMKISHKKKNNDSEQKLFFNKSMYDFNISTLNLNGARTDFKRAAIFKLMDIKYIGVMIVEETHSCHNNESEWRKVFNRQPILSHRSSLSLGDFYLLGGLYLSLLLLMKIKAIS